jgi:hypothetical protein
MHTGFRAEEAAFLARPLCALTEAEIAMAEHAAEHATEGSECHDGCETCGRLADACDALTAPCRSRARGCQ